ncbi:MAG: type II toxin-antitoxin system mRNA interferase toxin, RelE/StbE family [Patescibacteria group bacterium]
MNYYYAPSFLRQLKKLDPAIQAEAIEKISLFKTGDYGRQLKVHKLSGWLNDRYSFSVDYRVRIVFTYVHKRKGILFVAIGDHDVYKN